MRNILISGLTALIVLLSGNIQLAQAQDSLKKTTAPKPVAVKPATAKPVTAKIGIPINPKTGRPYTKYGYGYYATHKSDTLKAAHRADSLKNAAAIPVAPAAPADKSLEGQYQYLLTKVYAYQRPLIAALWKNVSDTLKTNHHKLADAQAKAIAQSKTIAGLQADANTKEQEGSLADEISLFGISMSKGTYSLLMWGLVVVLAAVAMIVIYRSGSLKHEARYRAGLYTELEDEFKAYKTKTNDKEKKLARELQTERNKVDELMGRG